jgi:hypothetical protein
VRLGRMLEAAKNTVDEYDVRCRGCDSVTRADDSWFPFS